MADIRIKVAKDKAEFLKALRATEETPGPFQSYADALVFAAALEVKWGRREPIAEYSKVIDPIRQDIFYGKGLCCMIKQWIEGPYECPCLTLQLIPVMMPER